MVFKKYKTPRIILVEEEKELAYTWWLNTNLESTLVLDEGLNLEILERTVSATRITPGQGIPPYALSTSTIIVGAGSWKTINYAKLVSCTATSRGNIGLLGVREPYEKNYLVLIPYDTIRYALIPRAIVGAPYNMIIEHPCCIPHEVVLLAKNLENKFIKYEYDILRILSANESLGSSIKDASLEEILRLYTINLGFIDSIAESLILVLKIHPVLALSIAVLSTLRRGALPLKSYVEDTPLEKIFWNCCESVKGVEGKANPKLILENVIRTMQLYSSTPPSPKTIHEVVEEAIRLVEQCATVNNDMG